MAFPQNRLCGTGERPETVRKTAGPFTKPRTLLIVYDGGEAGTTRFAWSLDRDALSVKMKQT